MYYSHIIWGMVVISSIAHYSQSMVTDKKKPRKTIEIVRAQVSCERASILTAQLQRDQAHLVASFFATEDNLAQLRPRL